MKSLLYLGMLGCGAMLMAPTKALAWGGHAGGAGFERSGTFANRHGSGTFSQSVQRANGTAQRNSSWQYADGQTGSHSATNTYNKSTGQFTHDASTTYANGKTSSSEGTGQKTSTGYTYTGTHVGTNGQTTDVNRTATNEGNGVRTVDSTYTNPATGKTSTVDTTYDKTATGYTKDTTTDLANGKTVTSDQTITKTSNGYTKDGTVTGPNGQTATDDHTVTFTNDGNGETTRTASTQVTGPNGQVKTYGNTETYTTVPTTPPQD